MVRRRHIIEASREKDHSSRTIDDRLARRTYLDTLDRGEALNRLDDYEQAIATFAHERAEALREDHDRVKAATRGEGATTEVEPALPADVIGLYVLVPEIA